MSLLPLFLHDEEGRDIMITVQDSNKVRIDWQNMFSFITNNKQFKTFEFIKSFRIGVIVGMRLNIGTTPYPLGGMAIDDREEDFIFETEENKLVPSEYGRPNECILHTNNGTKWLTVNSSDGYLGFSGAVDYDTKIEDIEFVKFLSNPQDRPHGALVKVRGQKQELNRSHPKEISLDRVLWAEVHDKFNNHNVVDDVLEALEMVRMMKSLRGKDIFELTKQLDVTKEKLARLNLKHEEMTKDGKGLQAEIRDLTKEVKETKESLQKLEEERGSYKEELNRKLQKVLSEF